MAGDAAAILDGRGIAAAHVVGASLGGAIAQWLAVHRPERVLTLTAIMTGPMGADDRAAMARALAGEPADPDDLPPPTSRVLDHFVRLAGVPRCTREERVAAALETWRVLNGDGVPFDEQAARRNVEISNDRTADHAAAADHDLAARRMTSDRLAPLSSITAPTLVVHGGEDPLRPLPHGRAVAAAIPGARLCAVRGMGTGSSRPDCPAGSPS